MLQEQCEHLANIRYEKDYWKELELKGIIGEGPQPSYDDFCKDCNKNFELSQGHVDKKLRLIRRLIDGEQFAEILSVLEELQESVEEGEPPVVPREPQKDNEKVCLKSSVYGTYVASDSNANFLVQVPIKDTSESELSWFTILLQPDDKIALKTAIGKFLSANENGNLDQVDKIQSEKERFTLIVDDDLEIVKYAFKTAHSRYISANDKGKVVQAIQCTESEWFWKILPGTAVEDEPIPQKPEEEESVAPVEDE